MAKTKISSTDLIWIFQEKHGGASSLVKAEFVILAGQYLIQGQVAICDSLPVVGCLFQIERGILGFVGGIGSLFGQVSRFVNHIFWDYPIRAEELKKIGTV